MTPPTIVNSVFGDPHGGRWNVVLDYNRALRDAGFSPVCVTNPGVSLPDTPTLGVKVSGHYDLVAAWKLRKFLKTSRVAAAICHCGRSLAAFKLAAKGLGIPVIGVSHSINAKRLARADWSIAISEEIASTYLACGQSAERIVRIHNSVDTSTMLPVPDEIPPSPVKIGLVSRMVQEKGFFLLVDAVSLLVARGIDCQLVLAGDGPDRDAILARVAEAGLSPRCLTEGWISDPNAFYSRVDIATLPSYREAFPLTILEAIRAGKPVIATDLPGCREALHDGALGGLFRKGDASDLADKLAGAIANWPLTREKCIRAQAVLREDYSHSRQSRDLGAFLGRILPA